MERYDIPPCEEYPDDSGHNCIDNRVVYNFFCTPCRTRLAYDLLTAQVEKLQRERDRWKARCDLLVIDRVRPAEAALTTTREALELIVEVVDHHDDDRPECPGCIARATLSAIEEKK